MEISTKEEKTSLILNGPTKTKEKDEYENPCHYAAPYAQANILNIISCWWIGDLLQKIYQGNFDAKRDIWKCAERDSSEVVSQRLEQLWKDEVKTAGKQKASIIRVFWRSEKKALVIIVMTYIISACLVFVISTFCVSNLLTFASGEGKQSTLHGITVAVTLILVAFARFIVNVGVLSYSTFVEARVRSGVMALLYRKLLKLDRIEDGDVGMIINVLLTDGDRIRQGIRGLIIVTAPTLFITLMAYAIVQTGQLALVVYGVFLLQIIITLFIAGLIGRQRKKVLGYSDKRIKAVQEILRNMKIIKIYAWEQPFLDNLLEIRRVEERYLRTQRAFRSAIVYVARFAVLLVQVTSVLALILTQKSVTAAEVFTVLSTVYALKYSINSVPQSVRIFAEFFVALARVKGILLLEEFQRPIESENVDNTAQFCAVFHNATFTYTRLKMTNARQPPFDLQKCEGKLFEYGSTQSTDPDQNCNEMENAPDIQGNSPLPALENLNFAIMKGRLVGVCGPVGVGKSSFLTALLGRLNMAAGTFAINGTIALVPQQPWILNATVKENIVFGNDFDPARYARVLESCCLLEDIGHMPAGDGTEIGERGINLSGGQKQRVSLARAVYSDRDVFLLDDPLSAVDNKVASTIFKKCIKMELKRKTVLLVSHQVRFISQCDSIIFLTNSGIVIDRTHSEMVATDEGYQAMMKSEGREEETRYRVESEGFSEVAVNEYRECQSEYQVGSSAGRLTFAERQDEGRPSWKSLLSYNAASGRFSTVIMVVIGTWLTSSQHFPGWFVAIWLDSAANGTDFNCSGNCPVTHSKTDDNFMVFLVAFCSIPIFFLIMSVISCLFWAWVSLKASGFFHNKLLDRIIRATMTFFDTTPIGRIQNLFSADQDKIDNGISNFIEATLRLILEMFLILITMASASPIVLVMVVPCIVIAVRVWNVSTAGVRDLQRLENVVKSPICSAVTSSTEGLCSIVAYDKEEQIIKIFDDLLDRYTVLSVCNANSNRWVAFRLEFISWVVVCAVSIIVASSPASRTTAQAGLTLVHSLHMSNLLIHFVHNMNEIQGHLISVERLNNNIKDAPQEAPSIVDYYRPPALWPAFGHIVFHDFCLRYQMYRPRVLHNISFRVKANEKVGIVGRTGAGKSSLMVALFRLVEKESGGIFIDGLDISKLGLKDLRSKMSLIPQDPVLFAGTIRSNLDTFNTRSDFAIWEALYWCHLKNKILSFPSGLDHRVAEGGSNFSVGERQLLCLARSLLDKAKILLLDEATASVDHQTDCLIQDTIRTAFPECTMLIIAHRLNTVLDCDKILVMDGGRVMEYDTPERLLNSDSMFKQLLMASSH